MVPARLWAARRADTGAVEEAQDPALQLRIEFPQPRTNLVLGLSLRGLTVVAAPWEGTPEDAASYLRLVGIHVRVEEDRGLVFPLAELIRLRELPTQVRLEPLGSLVPLVRYALASYEAPATVTVRARRLQLAWFEGAMKREEEIDERAAAALPVSALPFVATEEAWAQLERLSGLPLALGRVQLNHDGFLEIATHKPQHLEAAPLPGLFRIDATHYGMSKAYLEDARQLQGLEWVGQLQPDRPLECSPDRFGGLLSRHLTEDLPRLVAQVSELGGQMLVYRTGLGRRMLALAALESLDGFPALVVSPPWGLWVWQRNADLFGRSTSLRDSDADVRLITYFDLTHRPRLDGFSALVLDDLGGPDATTPGAAAAVAGLSVLDAYRIGICASWPTDPEEGCRLLNLVRPGEFDLADQPLTRRYPLRPVERAEEHARPYLLRRDHADPADMGRHRRSEVTLVPPVPAQLTALAALDMGDVRRAFTEACDIVAAGTPDALSPKLAAVTSALSQHDRSRHRVAIATRSRRAGALLAATLAAHRPRLLDDEAPGEPEPGITIVMWTERIPDLRGFDEVLLLDYPWSSLLIDAAIGTAAADRGPRRVVVLHSPGTVDDRLATYAARRRELGVAEDPATPPSPDELAYLLARRW